MTRLLRSLIMLTLPALLWQGASARVDSRLWLQYDAPVLPVGASAAERAEAEIRAAGVATDVAVAIDRSLPVESPEAFRINRCGTGLTVTSPSDAGLLYGAFEVIRLNAAGMLDAVADTIVSPAYPLRILNHWDNLDGTIERGYAGRSLWKWDELPATVSPRYADYARACASVGINASVLNNVNASPKMLTPEYLEKVAAIADAMRPWGVKVYLSVNFATPQALGELPTADPLDPAVAEWWRAKADSIYALIPDFGGFLVKANSEGQPGPCDFGRTHAEGANMLAEALRPHGGKVMWRAFVYSASDDDRACQAYNEFTPLDGEFAPEVILQVKNGPIDFQPREPASPLFSPGAMAETPLMVEFQITQEYLGHSNHLAFLAPMWSEFFGEVSCGDLAAAAGVANVGDAPNFTAHPLAQANWYAFGRLAWAPRLSPVQIAREWARASLYAAREVPDSVVDSCVELLCRSRETIVDYMMPLGLHHIFAWGHHYGPEPWCYVEGARPDWLPSYYHRADSAGIGFDRTSDGSGATLQYIPLLTAYYDNPDTCPEKYLLWFHHLPWDYTMKSGRTLWEELCAAYTRGADDAAAMAADWEKQRPWIDPEVMDDVAARMAVQRSDAAWWRDACTQYFSKVSGRPVPEFVPAPADPLDRLMKAKLPIDNYTCPTPAQLNAVRTPR